MNWWNIKIHFMMAFDVTVGQHLATCRNPEEAKVRNIAYISERQSVKCGRLIIVCS
jgi:hypothetical protein